jgi:hypothetical protein
MQRRRFLATVGASFTVAGCLSRGSMPGSGSTDTPTPSGEPNETATPTEARDSTETATTNEFALGETTGDVNPHGLTVRNEGDDSRTVELTVSDAETDETLLTRSYSLDGDEAVSGELRGPATYEVRVTFPEEGTEHATMIDYFDTCNSYGTTVSIDEDGSITSRTITTLVACDPVTDPLPEEFAVGEPTGEFNPHGLTVHNDGDATRTVELHVADAETGETLLDRSYSLGDDEAVSGELRALDVYEVRVSVPEADTKHVVPIDHFDTCNAYGTTVTVNDDGSLSSTMVSTEAACPPSGASPSEGFELGEGADDVNPHALTVRNDSEVGLSVAVHITDAETNETLLDETYALGPGEAVDGELRGPAAYDVSVEAVESGTEHVTTVDYFDTCNGYGTTVTIGPDASLSSETFRTDVYCGDE